MTLLNPHVVEQLQTTFACPVQIEGRLDSGEFFYFRYRGGRAQLGVGPTDEAAVDATFASDCPEVLFGDWLQGVFESDADLNNVFDQLLAQHRTAEPTGGTDR